MKKTLDAFKWFGIVGGLAVWGWLGFVVLSRPGASDTLVIPNSFSVGQVADPSTVNANFDAIKNLINGKIDNDNWDSAGPDLTCANLDLTAACATSTFIVDGTIVNADVNASAAIAYSKLNLAGSIVTGDITDATIATVDIAGGAVTNVIRAERVSDVNDLNCATLGGGSWTDATGFSWTDTFTSGAQVLVTVNIAGHSDTSSPTVALRLLADGSAVDTYPNYTQTSALTIEPVVLRAKITTLSGSKVLKVQCQDDSAGTTDLLRGSVVITEFKR